MRFSNSWLLIVLVSTLAAAGCGTFFSRPSSLNSWPVQVGYATTNDSPATAWLRVAQAANTTYNPTPTATPINLVIGGLIGLTSVFSGWYVHRSGVKRGHDNFKNGSSS
jgi:uncharacterized protein YceK